MYMQLLVYYESVQLCYGSIFMVFVKILMDKIHENLRLFYLPDPVNFTHTLDWTTNTPLGLLNKN